MSRFIGVDIYGRNNCSKSVVNQCSGNDTECLQLIDKKYLVKILLLMSLSLTSFIQFYLSLENSLCQDYVTEKFWKILPLNVIPVVLNGADMQNVAPYHSYIDVADFNTFKGIIKSFFNSCSTRIIFCSRICKLFAESVKKSFNVCIIFLVERVL